MYLAIGTRPDISYAVGVVSRYLERSSLAHINAVKRILRYIKGTSECFLNIVGYSNADYAGDIETRISTSGYIFNIGSGVSSCFNVIDRVGVCCGMSSY